MAFKEVLTFPFSKLSNNNALQTFDRMEEVYDKLDFLEITAFLDGFKVLKNQLSDTLRPHMGSAITRRLEKRDPERDRLYNQFNGIIRTAMKASNPEISNAANEVDVVLRRNGNPVKQQMDEETRTIAKIVHDLHVEKIYPFLKSIPGAESVLTELEELNDLFAQEYNDRIEERIGQKKGATTKLRSDVNDAATLSVKAVNAYALLFKSTVVDEAIDELNTILDQARINLSNRGKGSGSSEDPESPDPENPPIEIRDKLNKEENINKKNTDGEQPEES
jgi:hypothetical protein